MPLPFLVGAGAIAAKVALGAGVAAGVAGAAAGVKGAIDSKEAKGIQERAEEILEDAKIDIEKAKENTSNNIQILGKTKLNIASCELNDFVNVYSRLKNVQLSDSIGMDELKKINLSENDLKEMRETAIGAIDVLGGIGAGLGAGALLGWGAYGGVMALGTASTGTAIGALSGAAATNATLAWLGGGSLAAGGGGMALGSAVLGGLVAGPALLIAGGIFSAKSKEKLENAKSNLSEAKVIDKEIRVAIGELLFISSKVEQIDKLLNELNKGFRNSIIELNKLTYSKNDWNLYTIEEKMLVATTLKFAQAVKTILDTPILDEGGSITEKANMISQNSNITKLINI